MQAQGRVSPERMFPNDRTNMLSRHVYTNESDSASIAMPMLRTERQKALVQKGGKNCAAKTFTRF